MLKDIANYISHSVDVKIAIQNNEKLLIKIYKASQLIIDAIKKGKKIITAGNGGSAADAMHFATEFCSKFYKVRSALPCVSLCADTCTITAIGNDYNFEQIFSRQLEAIGKAGDVFLAISTSGNSKNIKKAIDTAKKMGLYVVFLTGEMVSGDVVEKANIAIKVPSSDTALIQEAHAMIEHIISFEVEKEFD